MMLDGRFTFDNFVVGANNRLAASAARAVAESPGTVYNPLLIHGGSGLGKTHLLVAVGNRATELHPGLSVELVALDDFVDELHQAIASGQADSFKRRYADVGVLLLDDVQFLSGRIETQSEVLRVLNTLQQRGRQIVMASDRPPASMSDVDDRLIARLSGGLVVDVSTPDYDTRVSILRSSAAGRGVRFGTGVVEEIARAPAASIREMQGSLNRVIANQALAAEPLTVPEVWQILGTGRTPPVSAPDEFEAFLRDITTTVEKTVDVWRLKLGDRIAHWSGQGYVTTTLQAAFDAPEAPDVDELDAAFAVVVERLRSLEAEAIRLDPGAAGSEVFHDPSKLHEAEAIVAALTRKVEPPPGPEPGRRLHDLTRCQGNRLALQAIAAAIEEPGRRYNPLFLHGARGAGKTHIAHAAGNALIARDSDLLVACASGEALTTELQNAISQGSIERWRARYAAADALIVDGIQAIDGSDRVQAEFFRLFNSLRDRGCQIVLTADRPLSGFRSLEERLRTRFESGLVVHLGAPPAVDRTGRATPVHDGDEAAAPTIDVQDDGRDFEASLAEVSGPVTDPFFLDSEKVIVDWPDAGGRLIEEYS
ncbi:MAG: DnaA/Hda family protein [Gemmatimonadota bacterium]